MDIELQHYNPVFYNAVYARDTGETRKVITENGEKEIQLRTILVIGRYEQPSEDDVVKLLQTTARNITCGLKLPKSVELKMSPLEKIMRERLPDKAQHNIANGESNHINFIREHTPAPNYSEDEKHQYLLARQGVFPVEELSGNAKAGNISGAEWYDGALQYPGFTNSGFGERFRITIELKDGVLPDKTAIYEPGEKAKSVIIQASPTSFGDLNFALNELYFLDTVEKIMAVRDIRENILNENALAPVAALNRMIMEQQLQSAITVPNISRVLSMRNDGN